MRFILVLHLLAEVLSMSTKLCVNCKFFRNDLFMDDKFGKCIKSPKVDDIDYFLVTGVKPSNKVEYHFCSIVRKYKPECGVDGKLFEPKNKFFSKKDKN